MTVHRRKAFTLIELLVVIAIIAILIALLVPAVQKVREAAARTQCSNNLKQLALGCHNYHDSYKVLPASYLDSYGVNGHGWSWIAMILPYIEQAPLYNLANLSSRTTAGLPTSRLSVNGGAIIATPIPIVRCPSDPDAGLVAMTNRADVSGHPVALTNYLGVAGSNWQWGNARWNPGWLGGANSQEGLDNGNGLIYRSNGTGTAVLGGTHPPQHFSLVQIQDGTSNTFLIGESLPSRSLWCGGWAYSNNASGTCAIYPNATQPNGKLYALSDWPDNYSFHSMHTGGLMFAFADGSIRFISTNIDIPTYRFLATRSGGETLSANAY